MIGAPWFLLAAGILIVIIGALLAHLPGPPRRRRRAISARMRDDEIVRHLKDDKRLSVPGLIMLLGIGCILVSVAWRIARAVL